MAEKNQRARATAYKVPVSIILSGKYVKDEEEFAPNYIEMMDIRISRVNIMGVVVSVDTSDIGVNSVVLDDGNAKILVRGFEQNAIPGWAKVGDIINIIGRVREFGSERYIMPEIIRKTEQKWMLVRKLEIKLDSRFSQETKAEQKVGEIEEENLSINSDNSLGERERIIELIRQNDKGNGIEIDEIIFKTKINNCEKIIEDMLKEGEIFENIPGKVKVLE